MAHPLLIVMVKLSRRVGESRDEMLVKNARLGSPQEVQEAVDKVLAIPDLEFNQGIDALYAASDAAEAAIEARSGVNPSPGGFDDADRAVESILKASLDPNSGPKLN